VRWCDLDLSGGTLAVRQTLIAIKHTITFSEPKTAKGRRVVALDDATIAALRAHKARQAQERLPLGLGWDDTGLVFTREDGQPLHPEHISAAFGRRVRSLKLPSLSVHGLRHTWATLALQSGVHPKIVSERLGHANISITLNTYSHVTPTMQADAARTVARLLFGDSAG
jgi:integrase